MGRERDMHILQITLKLLDTAHANDNTIITPAIRLSNLAVVHTTNIELAVPDYPPQCRLKHRQAVLLHNRLNVCNGLECAVAEVAFAIHSACKLVSMVYLVRGEGDDTNHCQQCH